MCMLMYNIYVDYFYKYVFYIYIYIRIIVYIYENNLYFRSFPRFINVDSKNWKYKNNILYVHMYKVYWISNQRDFRWFPADI